MNKPTRHDEVLEVLKAHRPDLVSYYHCCRVEAEDNAQRVYELESEVEDLEYDLENRESPQERRDFVSQIGFVLDDIRELLQTQTELVFKTLGYPTIDDSIDVYNLRMSLHDMEALIANLDNKVNDY